RAGDRSGLVPCGVPPHRGIDPQEDPRPGVVDRQGLREAGGHHAQDVRHDAERRAARSAGAVPGGAQMNWRRYADHPFWQAAALLVAVPALVGLVAYGQVRTTVAAPPNLRSIHPAPPSEITFRGKTITLTGLDNPLRQHAESIPAYTADGKRLYYQNCLPCHGDHLDGQGHYAPGFNPLPANFQDNGTIAQLTESFVFWRVAKG